MCFYKRTHIHIKINSSIKDTTFGVLLNSNTEWKIIYIKAN